MERNSGYLQAFIEHDRVVSGLGVVGDKQFESLSGDPSLDKQITVLLVLPRPQLTLHYKKIKTGF